MLWSGYGSQGGTAGKQIFFWETEESTMKEDTQSERATAPGKANRTEVRRNIRWAPQTVKGQNIALGT